MHKEARGAKQALVDQAEALIGKGADGIPAYRDLLASWKTAGRAGKKVDDALWAKFKAAGDALYSAKAEIDAKDSVEFEANLAVKLELLTEAEKLSPRPTAPRRRRPCAPSRTAGTRPARCRATRCGSSRTACARSRPPCASSTRTTGSAPTPSARSASEGFLGKLNDSISKLERELEEAKAAGDPRRSPPPRMRSTCRRAGSAPISQ